MFNKSSGERPTSRTEGHTAAEGTMSVIGVDMRIVGDVESSGVIKVEGTIEGAVRGAKQVLLGRSGVILGDVHAGDAVIGGKVVGSVISSERVELQATATVEGDIHTRSIVVFEGGQINGNVRVGESAGPRSVVPASGLT
jgi:cytoskeletal protein CcmA (bactofilin family)